MLYVWLGIMKTFCEHFTSIAVSWRTLLATHTIVHTVKMRKQYITLFFPVLLRPRRNVRRHMRPSCCTPTVLWLRLLKAVACPISEWTSQTLLLVHVVYLSEWDDWFVSVSGNTHTDFTLILIHFMAACNLAWIRPVFLKLFVPVPLMTTDTISDLLKVEWVHSRWFGEMFLCLILDRA